MALNKQQLIDDLAAIEDIDVSDGEKATLELREKLADAIEAYVKSGDILVSGGSSSGSYKVE